MPFLYCNQWVNFGGGGGVFGGEVSPHPLAPPQKVSKQDSQFMISLSYNHCLVSIRYHIIISENNIGAPT